MTIGRIPSVEGGIQPTIVDAKGDLIAAVAADSVNRLAVGSNDQVLVADSGASTGLAWKSYGSQLSSSNPVLNSDFSIWQRGTSFTASGVYTADRWFNGSNTGQTFSRQTTSDTTNLPFIQYCMRAARNSGTSNTNLLGVAQSIETVNSIPFAGKTVTLSFYARKGADQAGTVTASLLSGTGTDQRRDFGTGFTGEVTVANLTPTLTTTWVRYTLTGTIPTNATELAVLVYFAPTGTAGAADYIEVTGLQIDVGSVAQPFRRAMNTIQGELALAQRYYQRFNGQNDTQRVAVLGGATTTSIVDTVLALPVPMRTTISTLEAVNLGVYHNNNGTLYSGGTWSLLSGLAATPTVRYTHGSAVFTQGGTAFILQNGATLGYIGLSAELQYGKCQIIY